MYSTEILTDSSLLVTDYSSVFFDFAYMDNLFYTFGLMRKSFFDAV